MQYRWRCPNCGKSMTLSADDAGRTVLCGACGSRVVVPTGFGAAGERAVGERLVGPPSEAGDPSPGGPAGSSDEFAVEEPAGAEWAGEEGGNDEGADIVDFGPAVVGGAGPADPRPAPIARPVPAAGPPAPAVARPGIADAGRQPTGRRWVAIAAAVVVSLGVGLGGGWLIGRGSGDDGGGGRPTASGGGAGLATKAGTGSATAAIAADERSHVDLVRLKSEAEALAVDGKLAEAHAKYQALMAAAAARPPTSPLMWDIVERAKVDQDRIYWILLARMDKADRAFGPGTPALPNLPNALSLPPTAGGATRQAAGGDAPDRRPLSEQGPMAAAAIPPTAPTTSSAAADAGPVAAGPSATAPASRPTLLVARVGGVELRPVSQNLPVFNPAVLDVQVDTALRRGSAYLLGLFENGELPPEQPQFETSRRGLHAAIVYALLSAGQAVDDPRLRPTDPKMALMIEKLKEYRLESPGAGAKSEMVVYARSLRAAALSVYNRPADRAALRADVDWLVGAAVDGAFGPDDRIAHRPKGVLPPGAPPTGGGVPNGAGGLPPPLQQPPPVVQPPPFPISPPPRTNRNDNSPPPGPPGGTINRRPDSGVRRNENQYGNPPPTPSAPQPRPQPQPQPQPAPPPPPAPPPSPKGGSGRATPPPGLFDPAGPLTDDRGRPIEFAHNGERTGGWTPPPPALYNPPPTAWVPVTPLPGYAPGARVANASWDNFNSLFGLFGVWCGAEAGVAVPPGFWKDVTRHWTDCDLSNGQWGYGPTDRTGMLMTTAGGVASLLMAHDWAGQSDPTSPYLGARFPPELTAGLGWLSAGNNAVNIPGFGTRYVGYDLFALSRAGLMSGNKYFGAHDWYPELAGKVVGWQYPNGSWGRVPDGKADNAIDTAFHLLFLAHGRHPVLMNKLQYAGAWQNRPRDAANAASYLGRTVERPLNWQVVTLDRPGLDWQDAPILYVAGDDGPKWTDREVVKLRAFADGGGLLFLHADKGSGAFNRWAADLSAKLYPKYPLVDLPADHPLYTVAAKARPAKAKLRGASNGSRLLVLVSADDLAGAWQRRAERSDADAYRFLVNLWTYATGKTPARPRLDTADIPPPPGNPAVAIPVARVTYDGNWDPEPGAWPRLGRYLHWETNAGVDLRPVPAGGLLAGGGGAGGGGPVGLVAPLAHLTGTAAYAPTPAEMAGLRAYVEAGGVLLVEACGGSQAFRAAAEGGGNVGGGGAATTAGGTGGAASAGASTDGWLTAAFPGMLLGPATPDAAPLARTYDVQDDFVGGVDVRPFTAERLGAAASPADRLRLAPYGKGYVLYCPLDLSTGLSGSKAWGVAGYSPDPAIGIAKNVVVWAAARGR